MAHPLAKDLTQASMEGLDLLRGVPMRSTLQGLGKLWRKNPSRLDTATGSRLGDLKVLLSFFIA